MKMDGIPGLPGSVFVSMGIIDYEFSRVLGVRDTLDDAKSVCVPFKRDGAISAEEYDTYRIEEWPIGASQAARHWTRDTYGDDTDWQSCGD